MGEGAARGTLVVPRVYAIADAGRLASRDLAAVVAELADAGIGWIQVRAKRFSGAEWRRTMDAVCGRLGDRACRCLWVNDRVDVAAIYPVAGVHLGQRDLPPRAARAVLGGERLIGCSAHDPVQVEAAERDPAVDVVAIGPVYTTTSKRRPDPTVGLAGVAAARAATRKPLVAIGGIDHQHARDVWRSGADGVAVISALLRHHSVFESARRLQHLAEQFGCGGQAAAAAESR